MLLIGLTGSIATGKTTVSTMLREAPHHLPIIDADVIARQVVEPGTRAYKAIVRYFGPTTPDLLLEANPPDMPVDGPLGRGRPLNRTVLGRRVFGDTEERKRDRLVLNGIVHPAVRWAIYWAIFQHFLRGHWAVVLDVPLLFESGLDVICGSVVVVGVSDPEVQMTRLTERNPELLREDAENRVRSQADVRVKAKRCALRGAGRGIVLWNDGTRDELREDVGKAVTVWHQMSPPWWSWVLYACPPLAAVRIAWSVIQNLRANRLWSKRDKTA